MCPSYTMNAAPAIENKVRFTNLRLIHPGKD